MTLEINLEATVQQSSFAVLLRFHSLIIWSTNVNTHTLFQRML